MSLFIVKLISGDKIKITEQEYQAMNGKTGLVFVPSLGETINLQSVSRIYPEGRDVKIIDRAKQLEGVLKDGTRMIKQFGRWYCADGQRDEQGKLCTEADPYYYPEIKSGMLPTPEEYEQEFKALPVEQWTARLVGDNTERPQLLEGRSSEVGLTKL